MKEDSKPVIFPSKIQDKVMNELEKGGFQLNVRKTSKSQFSYGIKNVMDFKYI